MATTSVSKRIVRIPFSGAGPAQAVLNEMLGKMNALKLAGTTVYSTLSTPIQSFNEPAIMQVEVSLIAANDTTLVANFAGWATRLGVALLDTEVSTFTQGH